MEDKETTTTRTETTITISTIETKATIATRIGTITLRVGEGEMRRRMTTVTALWNLLLRSMTGSPSTFPKIEREVIWND